MENMTAALKTFFGGGLSLLMSSKISRFSNESFPSSSCILCWLQLGRLCAFAKLLYTYTMSVSSGLQSYIHFYNMFLYLYTRDEAKSLLLLQWMTKTQLCVYIWLFPAIQVYVWSSLFEEDETENRWDRHTLAISISISIREKVLGLKMPLGKHKATLNFNWNYWNTREKHHRRRLLERVSHESILQLWHSLFTLPPNWFLKQDMERVKVASFAVEGFKLYARVSYYTEEQNLRI